MVVSWEMKKINEYVYVRRQGVIVIDYVNK